MTSPDRTRDELLKDLEDSLNKALAGLLTGATEIVRLKYEIEHLQSVLIKIWEICHIPTPSHKKAYTHFQEDFDAIRKLCQKEMTRTEEAR